MRDTTPRGISAVRRYHAAWNTRPVGYRAVQYHAVRDTVRFRFQAAQVKANTTQHAFINSDTNLSNLRSCCNPAAARCNYRSAAAGRCTTCAPCCAAMRPAFPLRSGASISSAAAGFQRALPPALGSPPSTHIRRTGYTVPYVAPCGGVLQHAAACRPLLPGAIPPTCPPAAAQTGRRLVCCNDGLPCCAATSSGQRLCVGRPLRPAPRSS